MKSYLGLVSEYTKVHKKKNRLTVICIAISVMLVTAIFGMAELSVKAQINAYIMQQGNFHVNIKGITESAAEKISRRSDVNVSDWVAVSEDTTYQGRELIVQGSGKEFAEQMNLVVLDGRYPSSEHEALLDKRALEQFGLSIGDTIEVPFTNGQTRQYRITGIYGDFSMLTGNDAHGLFLTVDGVRAIGLEEYAQYYYIQFEKGVNIRRALSEIKAEYGLSEEQISQNRVLLGLMGQSDDSAMWQLYITAGVLFVLVTMSGVFMISSSFNMSILERTQFFGLLRCLGATKKQVKRYVRLEGLQVSIKGIPIGLFAGCLVLWSAILVLNTASLRFVLPAMPLFQISWLGIGAGTIVGFLVVMLASRAPAKKAALVSPQAAVTGNINSANNHQSGRHVSTKLRIDTSMGIRHAFSNKKNIVLTAGSVALSIILLLSFSVLTTFMEHAATPLKPYAPDITVMGKDIADTLDRSVMEEIRKLPHIKQLYGRMFCYDILSNSNGQDGTATLISYDEPQLRWAEEMLIAGDIEDVRSGGVLIGYDEASKFNRKIGDTILLNLSGNIYPLHIAGILSDTPFNAKGSEWVLICAEEKFTELTGMRDYTVIDMQVDENISEQVRSVIPPEIMLLDKHQRNSETRAAYYTMAVFVYGFVFVIALVAFINIVNTVNASVSSRMGNYGVMRAVGMAMKQLKKMVIAEVASYTTVGIIVGGVLGLLFHKFFFAITVTSNWGDPWQPPIAVLLFTITAAILTTLIAASSPTKKIENTSIVEVVNAG